jgi:hypothetical protein
MSFAIKIQSFFKGLNKTIEQKEAGGLFILAAAAVVVVAGVVSAIVPIASKFFSH